MLTSSPTSTVKTLLPQIQGQGTRDSRWHLNRFLFQSRFMLHKCIISWGLVRHITRPIFLWDMKTIMIIIFKRRLHHACVHACFALTVGTRYRVFARLVVATVAAIVMVVHVVRMLNVVVVARAIFLHVLLLIPCSLREIRGMS